MKKLYFLGIGGSAMGALACACKDAGYVVSGSDHGVYSPMSEFLSSRGIEYWDSYSEENILSFNADQIVVGNAMSRGNIELECALDHRMNLVSMPELVRELFIQKHTSIVVSGTHGKTTTSSLMSWVLASAALPTGFFIGAVTGNFQSGCQSVSPPAASGFFVTEGDEYDSAYFDKRSKFLSYRPDVAVINNIEFDHADIFDSIDDIKKSFRLFARLVPRNGLIVANADDRNVSEVIQSALSPIQGFGFSTQAYWRAVDIDYGQDATHFTVLKKGFIFHRFRLSLLGEHNVMNALSVIAVAQKCGVSVEQIQQAFDTFKAPKRRLEEISHFGQCVVVDDFAHHPTAIRLTIGAARQKYPNRSIVACFEPRSNTTSRAFFQHDLISAFEEADEVVLGCINRPERYAQDQRLNRDELAESLSRTGKKVFLVAQDESTKSDWGRLIVDYLSQRPHDDAVILLLSNGDFGGLRAMLGHHG